MAAERDHGGAFHEAGVTEGLKMMLNQFDLLAILERLEPWHWRATDWRKLPNGRIVRFVRWGWKLGR